MEEIFYREARPADLESIRALYDTSFPITYDDSFYNEVNAKSRKGTDVFTYIAIVKKDGINHIVGAITFQLAPLNHYDQDSRIKKYASRADLTENRFSCYIMTVATHPNFKRRGIGTKLLQICEKVSRDTDRCVVIYLHVIYWNDSAMALYQKHGYSKYEFLESFYHFDSKTHDAYLFGKKTILKNSNYLKLSTNSTYKPEVKEGSFRQMLKSMLSLRL